MVTYLDTFIVCLSDARRVVSDGALLRYSMTETTQSLIPHLFDYSPLQRISNLISSPLLTMSFLRIFTESKCNHVAAGEGWKEVFLMNIKAKHRVTKQHENEEVTLWRMPFFDAERKK